MAKVDVSELISDAALEKLKEYAREKHISVAKALDLAIDRLVEKRRLGFGHILAAPDPVVGSSEADRPDKFSELVTRPYKKPGRE